VREALKEVRKGGELTMKRRRAGSPVYSFPGLDRAKSPGLERDVRVFGLSDLQLAELGEVPAVAQQRIAPQESFQDTSGG
jgi:hypothetical protein